MTRDALVDYVLTSRHGGYRNKLHFLLLLHVCVMKLPKVPQKSFSRCGLGFFSLYLFMELIINGDITRAGHLRIVVIFLGYLSLNIDFI